MNLAEISKLADQSRTMIDVGDSYADARRRWIFDPINAGKDMWWGKDQPYYKFLYLISKHCHGGVAIEIGTHAGIGFANLAAGAKASGNPKSWTIGLDKDAYESAIEVSNHYDNCIFINKISTNDDTIKIVENICQQSSIRINIMFIDATHTLNWVNEEIRSYKHLFSDCVILIFDDIIHADNNTKLPECFAALPGEHVIFPGLHTDNCIAVALCSYDVFRNWNPPEMKGLKC